VVTSDATHSPRFRRVAVALCWGAIIGQTLFTIAWLVSDSLQGGDFSPLRDDISDLGALTANHPWIILAAQGVSGVLTICFAIFVLNRTLAGPGQKMALGAWLVAMSAVAVDDLSDAFFRLDCQTSQPGCSEATAMASWHGQIHAIVGIVSFILLVIAPFFLARSMRKLPSWSALAKPTKYFGVGLGVLLAVYVGLTGQDGQGTMQRIIALTASAGVCLLAVRAMRIRHSATALAA
jgi:hypothetical membrane protein